MVIISSRPIPRISLMMAEPPAVSRKDTFTGLPSPVLPSQDPARDLIWPKDVCASDSASSVVAAQSNRAATTKRGIAALVMMVPFFIVYFADAMVLPAVGREIRERIPPPQTFSS